MSAIDHGTYDDAGHWLLTDGRTVNGDSSIDGGDTWRAAAEVLTGCALARRVGAG